MAGRPYPGLIEEYELRQRRGDCRSKEKKREVRKFGVIAFVFFGILCSLGIWRDKEIPTFLFGFLSMLGIGFIVFPIFLAPIYTAWQRLAHIIGRLMTAIILTMAYYLVITPTAWIKRIFGGRPLPICPDKGVATYWVDRDEPVQPKERFIKRY